MTLYRVYSRDVSLQYDRDVLHSLQSCITQFTIVMFYSLQASRFTVCNIVMFYTVYSRDVSSYGGVPVKH